VRSYRFLRAIGFVSLLAAVVAIAGFVVMQLWNWLVPALFGGPVLHFAQAVGLLVLTRLMFGRIGGGHGRRLSWRSRMLHGARRITSDERQMLREAMSRRSGRGDRT
jgi:hypothetical protein